MENRRREQQRGVLPWHRRVPTDLLERTRVPAARQRERGRQQERQSSRGIGLRPLRRSEGRRASGQRVEPDPHRRQGKSRRALAQRQEGRVVRRRQRRLGRSTQGQQVQSREISELRESAEGLSRDPGGPSWSAGTTQYQDPRTPIGNPRAWPTAWPESTFPKRL